MARPTAATQQDTQPSNGMMAQMSAEALQTPPATTRTPAQKPKKKSQQKKTAAAQGTTTTKSQGKGRKGGSTWRRFADRVARITGQVRSMRAVVQASLAGEPAGAAAKPHLLKLVDLLVVDDLGDVVPALKALDGLNFQPKKVGRAPRLAVGQEVRVSPAKVKAGVVKKYYLASGLYTMEDLAKMVVEKISKNGLEAMCLSATGVRVHVTSLAHVEPTST